MRKVEVSIDINVKPKMVIKAFTDFNMLKDWWHIERSFIELIEGGNYILTWDITDKGFAYVSSGIIERYDPNSELVISKMVYLNPNKPLLGPMSLSVKVEEANGISKMSLCQDGYKKGDDWDWYYNAVKEAWPVVLKDFKAYLELHYS